MKLVALHHRLSSFGGHRYNEGLGLIDESRRRGWELDLLVSVRTPDPVLRSLGGVARPVLDDPTFDFTRPFDRRVDDFARQLAEHAQPSLTADCRVLLTVATQCEAAALARWARSLPRARMPWFFVLFLSDRWNRAGARPDEPAEIETAARDIARLPPAVRDRIVLCAATPGLADELAARLRHPVAPVPMHLNYAGFEAIAQSRGLRPAAASPAIGLVGGMRPEKGSERIAGIVAACRTRTRARFVIQAFDEGADPATFARLRALGADPDVLVIDGQLDRSAYERQLAGLDAVLCPYERLNYKHRSSGIFAEAVATGLPAIVPSGTWLAAQIEAGRAAGVVFTDDAADCVADAVARCVENLDGLTRDAAARAGCWRETQSLGSCLDAMEQLRRSRAPAREPSAAAAGLASALSLPARAANALLAWSSIRPPRR